jgi:hypothetical protein
VPVPPDFARVRDLGMEQVDTLAGSFPARHVRIDAPGSITSTCGRRARIVSRPA